MRTFTTLWGAQNLIKDSLSIIRFGLRDRKIYPWIDVDHFLDKLCLVEGKRKWFWIESLMRMGFRVVNSVNSSPFQSWDNDEGMIKWWINSCRHTLRATWAPKCNRAETEEIWPCLAAKWRGELAAISSWSTSRLWWDISSPNQLTRSSWGKRPKNHVIFHVSSLFSKLWNVSYLVLVVMMSTQRKRETQ